MEEPDDAAITLRNAPDPVDAPTVAQALRGHYGLEASLTALRGERDTNFLVSVDDKPAFVLRIANAAERRVIADFRAAELQFIEHHAPELPVPRIHPTRDGSHGFELPGSNGERFSQLVTYLPGTPMAMAKNSTRHVQQLGEVAARMGEALKGFEHPGSRLPLLWDIGQARQTMCFLKHTSDPEQGRMVAGALAGFEEVAPLLGNLRAQVIHNDLNPHNIMMSDDGSEVVGIIDFGDSVFSALVNDAGVACSYLFQDGDDPLEAIRRFVSAYCSILPLTEDELAILPRLIATRLALTMIITNWRAARFPENAGYILRNQNSALLGLRCLSRLAPEQARDQVLSAGLRGGA